MCNLSEYLKGPLAGIQLDWPRKGQFADQPADLRVCPMYLTMIGLTGWLDEDCRAEYRTESMTDTDKEV
mgnify:FL=1